MSLLSYYPLCYFVALLLCLLFTSISDNVIDDKALVTEITYHTNDQLFKINLEYQKKYEKNLYQAIKDDTSGDYCDLLGMWVLLNVVFVYTRKPQRLSKGTYRCLFVRY